MIRSLNVLIPSFERPGALAVTLAGLCSQTYRDFDVVISDQTETSDPCAAGEVLAVVRLLRLHGHQVSLHKHLPRRGIAEQRQFLLEQAKSFYVLYLDNDVILEPDLVERLMRAIREERCAFVGSAPVGLSYLNEERPHQQSIELWDGPVKPERVTPDSAEWQRHHLHSAANILHVQQRMKLEPRIQQKYHVAWIGACVLYDTAKLTAVGAFRFWNELPGDHCGEDVLVQARLLERFGGCGIIPSGAYHQELPTTIPDRSSNAVELLKPAAAGENRNIMIEVPAGELLDKLTILEIKAEKIRDPAKLDHIRQELEHLSRVRAATFGHAQKLDSLVAELKEVNRNLWSIEDSIRGCEQRGDFGQEFIRLARAVYHQNDRRAAVKRSINDLTGSRLVEEKSYAEYKAA